MPSDVAYINVYFSMCTLTTIVLTPGPNLNVSFCPGLFLCLAIFLIHFYFNCVQGFDSWIYEFLCNHELYFLIII